MNWSFIFTPKSGNRKLFASAGSAHARLHFIESNPVNPPAPLSFCMLLRKHLQGGRITAVKQKRIRNVSSRSHSKPLNELGFTVSKKLIFEIMGKHSNIVLVDLASGKIIDAIKRVSFDVNRVRQILPGLAYQYPPAQDKTPFREITAEAVAAAAGQQSDPAEHRWYFSAFAGELALHTGADRAAYFEQVKAQIEAGIPAAYVYEDDKQHPVEFYPVPLTDYEASCAELSFDGMSAALAYYFFQKESSNQGRQKIARPDQSGNGKS